MTRKARSIPSKSNNVCKKCKGSGVTQIGMRPSNTIACEDCNGTGYVSVKPSAVVAQVGGTHYEVHTGVCPHCGGEIQHWDLYAAQPYLESYAAKELIRWREKGGVQDLEKVVSIIQKIMAIERLRASKRAPTP